MDASEQKHLIRTTAATYGFAQCRVTQPVTAQVHLDGLQHWVSAGMYGNMDWMAESDRFERRNHPMSMLNGVQSVISLCMPYTPPAYSLDAACDAAGQGAITAYAHGDDYHDVMKKRLKALAAELDAVLGKHDQRVFVDTAPVLEHALAASAGLGWQGKHSLTIHRELGSWFLLGEIFTTAELEPDAPSENHCGTCSACMGICPTKAIVAPYVVDARLCISYLTIEFDGFIPLDLRPLMGNRIYGCDDCQLVCPWNSHAVSPVASSDLLSPRGENQLPDLASLLRLNEEAFRRRFRKSPIRRTKRRGLLRNVCIAMGNSGQTAFVNDLMDVVSDDEAVIRGHAIWALGQLSNSENKAEMMTLFRTLSGHEKDNDVLKEISLSIKYIRGKYDYT